MKPFEITPVHPRLYLSNKIWIDRDLPRLRAQGIGAIVNLVEEHVYRTPASIACLHAPFVDGTYVDPAVLHRIYTFVAHHLKRTRVLIHCAAGVSRSAGIVVGQLLIENPHWTWERALRLVDRQRSVWVAMEVRESVLGYIAMRAHHPRTPAAAGRVVGKDCELLRDLKCTTAAELPELPAINWNSRGYKVKHNRIVGLGLFDVGLTEFPSAITGLSQLMELKMYGNRLRSLPRDIDRLIRLQLLGLFANEIELLPDALDRLPALRVLNLAGNRLTKLPAKMGGLARLRELYLQDNDLERLPASIGDLASLRHLHLQYNRLTQLTKSLANLTRLTTFSAEGNMITSLPGSLFRSPALRSLNLSGNQIKILPAGPWQMPKLENLNISRNALSSLPTGLSVLKSIRRLNIAWNRLTCHPMPVRQWLAELRAHGCVIITGEDRKDSQNDESGK